MVEDFTDIFDGFDCVNVFSIHGEAVVVNRESRVWFRLPGSMRAISREGERFVMTRLRPVGDLRWQRKL